MERKVLTDDIIDLFELGHTSPAIAKDLECNIQLVNKIIRAYSTGVIPPNHRPIPSKKIAPYVSFSENVRVVDEQNDLGTGAIGNDGNDGDNSSEDTIKENMSKDSIE